MLFKNGLLTSPLAEEVSDSALAFDVYAPTINTTTFSKGDRVMLTTFNLDGFFGLLPFDERRLLLITSVADAKLSFVVEAPAK